MSLDAVIKYFSSGFILCTGLAMAYEILVTLVVNTAMVIVVVIGLEVEISEHENDDDAAPSPDDMKKYMKDFAKDYPWVFAAFIFLNAFVIAALVEELSKYFSFWMVEHPDFGDDIGAATRTRTTSTSATAPAYLGVDTAEDYASPSDITDLELVEECPGDENENKNGDESHDAGIDTLPTRTLDSLGVGITVAMVATALGFACCENLLYVFVYTPPTIANGTCRNNVFMSIAGELHGRSFSCTLASFLVVLN